MKFKSKADRYSDLVNLRLKMSRIILAPAAEADAVEIWAYIAKDNTTAADNLLTRFNQSFLHLSEQPKLGRAVENLDIPNLRLLPLGSYLIFYRPLESGVEIARILHQARDIMGEFFRDQH